MGILRSADSAQNDISAAFTYRLKEVQGYCIRSFDANSRQTLWLTQFVRLGMMSYVREATIAIYVTNFRVTKWGCGVKYVCRLGGAR